MRDCCVHSSSEREPSASQSRTAAEAPRSAREVALKVIKNVDKYREAAKLEINVLLTIQRIDPSGHLYASLLATTLVLLSHTNTHTHTHTQATV